MILDGALLDLHVGALDVGIVEQYVGDLTLDLGEEVDEFDVSGEQQLSRGRGAEVELVVQQLKLHAWTARGKGRR